MGTGATRLLAHAFSLDLYRPNSTPVVSARMAEWLKACNWRVADPGSMPSRGTWLLTERDAC